MVKVAVFILMFILNINCIQANDTSRYLIVNVGLTGVSTMHSEGMKFGAITPSIVYKTKKGLSLNTEFYHFGYDYGFEKNYKNTYVVNGNRYGYPRKIDMKVFKFGVGKVKKFKNVILNPYLNLEYRFSNSGHHFYWYEYDIHNDHIYTTAYSPLNSIGIGIGNSLNFIILKHLNLSLDFSYNRFFDKGTIYAPKHYGSSEYIEVTNQWKEYKPINNILNLQFRFGYLLNI